MVPRTHVFGLFTHFQLYCISPGAKVQYSIVANSHSSRLLQRVNRQVSLSLSSCSPSIHNKESQFSCSIPPNPRHSVLEFQDPAFPGLQKSINLNIAPAPEIPSVLFLPSLLRFQILPSLYFQGIHLTENSIATSTYLPSRLHFSTSSSLTTTTKLRPPLYLSCLSATLLLVALVASLCKMKINARIPPRVSRKSTLLAQSPNLF